MTPTQLTALALVIAILVCLYWRAILQAVVMLAVLALIVGVVTILSTIQYAL